MTTIKLTNGTLIPCEIIETKNGVLMIETNTEQTTEELRVLFAAKENLTVLELQTPSGDKLGERYGYVCYSGILLLENGNKCIELTQEIDVTEQRITRAEGQARRAITDVDAAKQTAEALAVETAAYNIELDFRLSNIESGL